MLSNQYLNFNPTKVEESIRASLRLHALTKNIYLRREIILLDRGSLYDRSTEKTFIIINRKSKHMLPTFILGTFTLSKSGGYVLDKIEYDSMGHYEKESKMRGFLDLIRHTWILNTDTQAMTVHSKIVKNKIKKSVVKDMFGDKVY